MRQRRAFVELCMTYYADRLLRKLIPSGSTRTRGTGGRELLRHSGTRLFRIIHKCPLVVSESPLFLFSKHPDSPNYLRLGTIGQTTAPSCQEASQLVLAFDHVVVSSCATQPRQHFPAKDNPALTYPLLSHFSTTLTSDRRRSQ